jgi:hypothetical protein
MWGILIENSGLVFEEFYKLHGHELSPISNNQDFLIELVKLSHIVIEMDTFTGELEHKVTRLLEYVLRTEDDELALLLTETFLKLQTHSILSIIDKEITIKQLCDLFAVQFSRFKTDIYYHTLKLLNVLDVTPIHDHLNQLIVKKISQLDGNCIWQVKNDVNGN